MENNDSLQLNFGFGAALDHDSPYPDLASNFPIGDLDLIAKPEVVYHFVCALGADMVVIRNGSDLILPCGYELFLATYSGLVPEENPELVNELSKANSGKFISSDFKLMVHPLEGKPGQLTRSYHNNFESALEVINYSLIGSEVLEFEIGLAYADGLSYRLLTNFANSEFADPVALEKYLLQRMEYSKVKSIFSAERAEVDMLLKRYFYFAEKKEVALKIAC